MNQQDQNKTALFIIDIASYYGKTFSRNAINLMVNDFSNYTYEQIYKAFEIYRRKPENIYFPLPSQIIEIINPTLKDKTISVSLSNKIISKIKDKGRSWSQGFFGELSTIENGILYYEGSKNKEGKRKYFFSFKEALIDELGEIAFEYINSFRGGWESLCEDYYSEHRNDQAFFSQMREGIESICDLSKTGNLNKNISLPIHESIQLENKKKIEEIVSKTLNCL